MSEQTEQTLQSFTVTCKTKKCDNAEIAIDIQSSDADPIVICGVCAKKISDIIATPEPKE
jgi:tRNA A22 N-methylase